MLAPDLEAFVAAELVRILGAPIQHPRSPLTLLWTGSRSMAMRVALPRNALVVVYQAYPEDGK